MATLLPVLNWDALLFETNSTSSSIKLRRWGESYASLEILENPELGREVDLVQVGCESGSRPELNQSSICEKSHQ